MTVDVERGFVAAECEFTTDEFKQVVLKVKNIQKSYTWCVTSQLTCADPEEGTGDWDPLPLKSNKI